MGSHSLVFLVSEEKMRGSPSTFLKLLSRVMRNLTLMVSYMTQIANAQRQGPAVSSCEMYQIYIMTFHLKGKNEVTNNLCETLASMTNNTRIQFKEKQNRFNIFLPSNNQPFFLEPQ